MPISLTITPFIPSQATTDRLITTDRIEKITPNWAGTFPAGAVYKVYASNDGGTTWEELTDETEHTFTSEPTYGIIFRIRFISYTM